MDITTVGTLTAVTGDEDVASGIPIGFPFSFYGTEFESVNVCANGWLSFTDARIPSYNIQPLPNAGPQSPQDLVAPFWSDLHAGGVRRVYTYSDEERFVVSWVGMGHYFLPGTFTFQAQLYRTGEMRFQYHTLSGPDSFSSIGIQNATRDVGLNISFFTDYARPGLAVRILPPAAWLTAEPRSGRIPAGSNQAVNLTLDATRLLGGTYRSDLHVTSNDPDESDVVVPVQLVAIGVPEIELSRTAIDFGSVLTGGTARETLFVQNPGTDSLRVTSVTSSHPAFTASLASLTVPPLSQRRLLVDFTPLANGPSGGTLTLNSNDANEGVRTVALSGVGLPPPDIAVSPESLWVGLDVGGSTTRTVRVANPGESDLNVIVMPIEVPGGPGPGPAGMPSRLPVDPPPGGPPPVPPGPETNLVPRTQPPVALAGFYTGSRMTFGVTDFGEVMPFQFPNGNEHLATGAWISGYTVGFKTALGSDSLINTFTSGTEFRNGIVPESFQELEVSSSRVLVRVTTRTADGSIRIVRDITFLRNDQFVHVSTRIDNLTLGPLAGVIFKEFADWDVDNDPGDDTWDFDPSRNLVVASDLTYTGLAAGTTPQALDLYGWDDFSSYATFVNFPVGPIAGLDGLALMHFDLGTLDGSQSATAGASYCGGANLADLQAAVDRANAGVSWLTAVPDTFTVPAGAFLDVTVGFDAGDLLGGDYRAILRLASNDPNEAEFDVPVLLQVTGVPDLTVFPTALTFDSTFVGYVSIETLVVHNPGTDSLRVSNIVSPSPVFVAYPMGFVVGPGGSRALTVAFAPTSVGVAGGPLEFISNDPLEPTFAVPLQGVGLDPPIASAEPDSFLVGLFTGASHRRQLLLSNTGGSNLRATIEAVSTGGTDSTSSAKTVPAVVAMASPRPGVRLDDWNSQVGSRGPALNALPPARAFPASTLPLVIEDPAGDGGVVDLLRLRGSSSSGELRVAFELACCVDPFNFGGYLSLDIDQNPATGDPPYYGAPGHDIGQDVVVTLFSLGYGYVDVFQTPGSYLGAFPITFEPTGFSFAIPLAVLGADGDIDVSGVIGTGSGPTDWFPDTGHGTISSASWLSFTPAELTIPPGSTVAVDAIFDAAGLNGGDYSADIIIRTNDPGPGSTLIVPARLEVTGAPDIAVSLSTVDFGNLFIGLSSAESLIVRNEGTDVLEVTGIATSDPAFTVSSTSLVLPPGASAVLMLTFTPAAAVGYAGGLTLLSNDFDEPSLVVALTGQGLNPPIVGVAPESLRVGLLTNETKVRTLRVSNTGGSDLVVTVSGALSPPDSGSAPTSAAAGPETFEFAGYDPRRETPGVLPGPGGGQAPAGVGPEINQVPRTLSPRVLMGNYSGTQLAFGLTDLGEVMPFQFPLGNEHLAIGGWVSGYTVGYIIDGFARVFWAGHDTRFGIVPVSYQELVNSPTFVSVRVTTATTDGVLRIVRDFEFLRNENFIRVTTRLENQFGAPVPGVVYKEFADWDMDGDFTDDSWDYDQGRGLTIAWDQKFAGLAGGRIPDQMDMFGWGDHANYSTFVDFPVGPINNLDGTSLLHFNQGTLAGGGSISTTVSYSAAHSLPELLAAVDRANTTWLSVSPTQFTVPVGGHTDLAVLFDATGLPGGDYSAEIRLSSNDPVRGLVQVPVLLEVTGVPDIRVSPEALDFGLVFVGAASAETLEVRNLGSDVLEVSSIVFSDPAFTNGEGAFTLEPGASRTLLVTFQPGAPTAFAGTAGIHSNDPDHPVLSVALSGVGLTPPEVSVEPESLNVTLNHGESAQRTLVVANTGGSDLVATVLVSDVPPDSTGPIRVFPPDGSASVPGARPGPEANAAPPGGPARTLAGLYFGTKMSFGVSDLGEIMPCQFPVGVEHLSVGARISGYTVGFMVGSTPVVYLAGYDSRYGIEPESYQELAVTPSVISVRVTTRTIDGILRIIRVITFRRADQFVHVATTIENLTSSPIAGVVFKEYADWDVDQDAGGDYWTRDTMRGLVYAYDQDYLGLAGKDPPTLLDIYGWGDYGSYDTVVETFPIDPTPVDGMAMLHYSLGTLGAKGKVTRNVSYCAGATRPELLATVDRSGAGPPWIGASPVNLVVAPGQSQNVTVSLESDGLAAGEHQAIVGIRSNDPDEPSLNVPVRLTVVVQPDIAADPRDFGTVYVSQNRVESVVLRNEGAAVLSITGMTTTGNFAVVGSAVGSIPAGGTLSVPVRFTPTAACTPCTGALIVSSNDPDENPFSVPLTGIGVVPPQVTVGPSALQATLAPALGPPATTGSKTLTVGNPGGSVLSGRAVPVELALPEGARVIAVGPLAALESVSDEPRALGGGPDNGGYSWTASNEPGGPVFEWVDIAQTANRLPLVGNDNVLANVPIGFAFPFYGGTFSTVNLSTNGWMSFTSALVPGATPMALPSTNAAAPKNLVAPFWENLTFGSIQRGYALREADRFIVSYIAVATLPVTGAYTFQTILHSDGRIVFQYLNVPVPAPSLGVIGIQNGDGTVGLTVANGTSYVQRNFAVEFSPGVRWLRVVPGVFDLAAGGTLPLGVQFDATGLGDGDHQAIIRLMTNDLETPLVDVPVSLHVGSIVAAFKVNLRCARDDDDHETLGGDDDDDDGGGDGGGYHDDDDDDGGGQDDDDDGGHHDEDDDGGHDDEDDDGPARFVRGVITLPTGYDPHDVVLSSIRAAGTVPVSTTKGSRIHGQKLKVWFDRAALLAVLPDGDAITVDVVGEVDGVTWFQGTANACLHRPHMAAVAAELAPVEGQVGTRRIGRVEQVQRASQQARRNRQVVARQCPPARRRQVARRPLTEGTTVRVDRTQLTQVMVRLFEVPADRLVMLDGLPDPRFDPVGKASVQLGARTLQQAPVGRVADQHVVEAQNRFAKEPAGVGLDQLAAPQRFEAGVEVGHVPRQQVGNSGAREVAPDDRGALQDGALVRAQPLDAGGEQRVNGGRHLEAGERDARRPAVALARERAVLNEHAHQLADEQRIALAGGQHAPSQRGG